MKSRFAQVRRAQAAIENAVALEALQARSEFRSAAPRPSIAGCPQ